MSTLSKFLRKHSGELSIVGSLFQTLFRVIPLDPRDREAAEEAVQGIHDAAASIKSSISKIEKAGEIKITAAQIKSAVGDKLDEMIAAAAEAAVAVALSNMREKAAENTDVPEPE